LIRDAGLKGVEVATATGLRPTSISGWRCGRDLPDASSMRSLLQALRHDAAKDVGRTARGKGHHHTHGLGAGPILSQGRAPRKRQCACSQAGQSAEEAGTVHEGLQCDDEPELGASLPLRMPLRAKRAA
jgi:transcriptional regulator with XRE-family HTH domain